MIEYLEKIDHCIVLSVNGCYTPSLGQCMWFLSGKITWIPLYILLFYLAYRKLSKNTLVWFVSLVLLTVALSDLTSTYAFKKTIQRYRPSHNSELAPKLHFYEISKGNYYKGGEFGFVSSHAANFFAFSVFIGLALRPYYKKLIYVLIASSILVSFTRLYLGVHYLSDLIGGALIGIFYGFCCYRFIYLKKIAQ